MLWPLLFMFIKKTKKSVKTDLKILMMRMIFFFTVHKNPE